MRRARCVLMAIVMCFCAAVPAGAIEVVKAWESPLGNPQAVSVNSADGSAWVAAASGVWHVSADGTILGHTETGPTLSVSANPTDGSCWTAQVGVGDPDLGQWVSAVIHLGADGTELWHSEGFGSARRSDPLRSVAVNPMDGSCWVVYLGTWDEGLQRYWSPVIHFAADGTELSRTEGFNGPTNAVAVNPSDGSVWVADTCSGQVVHLSSTGSELWRGDGLGSCSLAVNSSDGSVWLGSGVHLAADGTVLQTGAPAGGSISVNSTDGSYWLADMQSDEVVHVAEDGTELTRAGVWGVRSLSVNPADGSCWVVSHHQVMRLTASGVQAWRIDGFCAPGAVSVNSADGSCWVGDVGFITHLSETGLELWRGADLGVPSVNPTDNTCWAIDGTSLDRAVVHIAEDGTPLVRVEGFSYSSFTSVDPTDGSCWVGGGMPLVHLAEDGTELWRSAELVSRDVSVSISDDSLWIALNTGDVVHLASDGTELWRGHPFGAENVEANARDGSCWVSSESSTEIAHLAEDGGELGRSSPGLLYPISLAVDPADGSCWVADMGANAVALVAEDGTELWRGPFSGEGLGQHVSVNPTDGSCWVADNGTGQVVHYVIPGWQPSLFYDVPWYYWAFGQVGACFDAGIVKGYDATHYQPALPVTRDQMAVYISRALAGGDGNIPDGPATPSFSDVPSNQWAYKHIEYAVSQNVVKGYDDGKYHSEYQVDRGTMAVYVARAMVAPGGDAAIPDPVPPATFTDVPDTFWAYKQVEYCVGEGVVKGYDDGNYHPANPVTRDQMAVYIARAFGLL